MNLSQKTRSNSLSRLSFKAQVSLPDGEIIVKDFPLASTTDQVKMGFIKESNYLQQFPSDDLCLGNNTGFMYDVAFYRFLSVAEDESRGGRKVGDQPMEVYFFSKRSALGNVRWLPVGQSNDRKSAPLKESKSVPSISITTSSHPTHSHPHPSSSPLKPRFNHNSKENQSKNAETVQKVEKNEEKPQNSSRKNSLNPPPLPPPRLRANSLGKEEDKMNETSQLPFFKRISPSFSKLDVENLQNGIEKFVDLAKETIEKDIMDAVMNVDKEFTFKNRKDYPSGSKNSYGKGIDHVEDIKNSNKKRANFNGEKIEGDNSHVFRLESIIAPQTCDLCATYILGLSSQVFVCEICDYTVHKKCLAFTPKTCVRKNLRTLRAQDQNSNFPNAQEAFEEPDKSGYLTKQGHKNRGWKRRFFAMKGNHLFYMKEKPEQDLFSILRLDEENLPTGKKVKNMLGMTMGSGTNTVPLGMIPLSDCLIAPTPETGKKFCFTIFLRNRNYPIYAESNEEMEGWINAIKQVVQSEAEKKIAPLMEKTKAFALPAPIEEDSDSLNTSNESIENKAKSKTFNSSSNQFHVTNIVKFDWGNTPTHELPYMQLSLTEKIPQLPTTTLKGLGFENQIYSSNSSDDDVKYFVSCTLPLLKSQIVRSETKVIPMAKLEQESDKPIPEHCPNRFVVFFRFSAEIVKSIVCNPSMTLISVVESLLSKVYQSSIVESSNIQDLYLKIVGLEECLRISNVRLIDIIYIRDSILKNKKVEFHVMHRSTIPKEFSFPWEVKVVSPLSRSNSSEKPLRNFFSGANGRRTSNSTIPLERVYLSKDLDKNLAVRIMGFHNLSFDLMAFLMGREDLNEGKVNLFIEFGLFYGLEPVCRKVYTKMTRAIVVKDSHHRNSNANSGKNSKNEIKCSALWAEWMDLGVKMGEIPRETRMCITLYGTKESGGYSEPYQLIYGGGSGGTGSNQCEALAWVTYSLIDVHSNLFSGLLNLNMWSRGKANPIATPTENPSSGTSGYTLILEFPPTPHPIRFTNEECDERIGMDGIERTPSENEEKRLRAVLGVDSLSDLSDNEKDLVWKYRHFLICNEDYPNALPKIVKSAPWKEPNGMAQLKFLLDRSPRGDPLICLELLDSNFPSTFVREYAVQGLKHFSDHSLLEYMPQLVQVLKFESFSYSPLVSFLLSRSFRNRRLIGQNLFWLLKAELHVPEMVQRYRLIIEALLLGTKEFQEEILKQLEIVNAFVKISSEVKTAAPSKKSQVLTSELLQLKLPSSFILPILPSVRLKGIIVDKCRYLDSATFPLWLVFQNADPFGPPLQVLFKNGDDLRQDALTLQMMKIMDRIWKDAGMNLHLTIYECLPTGENTGFIEIVPNSKTTAEIQKAHGGVTSAFKKTPLSNWLKQNNWQPEAYKKAVENFTLSLAGYSVLTFVLGISDRHNDNVMLSKDGHLFHIDFGYILGNVMKFGMIKRESAPFVLTPEMVFVMEAEKNTDSFPNYIKYCSQAYNALRKNANIFLILFSMMVATGLPQLKKFEDIYYIRGAFVLDKTDEEAAEYFTHLIYDSLNTTRTRVNNAIHILAHPD
eukprot:TRINITY_DN3251_c0_g3_i1.p1 TRINITY_DN3251_c0_g3~~TRINITY_DN3251_c0_g3_i1.p1  ORF type:complete len:1570 (-),score=656.28 TRINITY_DN3251_c0_g3_i1:67-4776(-)